jgi:endonuclease YncB( thermonuclease family)
VPPFARRRSHSKMATPAPPLFRATSCLTLPGMRLFLVTLGFIVAAASSSAQVPPKSCGAALVVDGDGLVIGGTSFRLHGIDAPETFQRCLDAKCVRTSCGIEARDRLRAHIAGREVCCIDKGPGGYGRRAAVCSIDDEDLNAWLVREGLALAYRKYSTAYVDQERAAHEAGRGMWAGAFHAPWDRRRGIKKVLGSLTCQNDSELDDEGAPSPECIIKGNVNKGERIYHVPGQRQYGSVKMSGSPKRWFCSEEEAQASGWRRAGN